MDFTKSPAIQELPITSAICDPVEGETVTLTPDAKLSVKGNVLTHYIDHTEREIMDNTKVGIKRGNSFKKIKKCLNERHR